MKKRERIPIFNMIETETDKRVEEGERMREMK